MGKVDCEYMCLKSIISFSSYFGINFREYEFNEESEYKLNVFEEIENKLYLALENDEFLLMNSHVNIFRISYDFFNLGYFDYYIPHMSKITLKKEEVKELYVSFYDDIYILKHKMKGYFDMYNYIYKNDIIYKEKSKSILLFEEKEAEIEKLKSGIAKLKSGQIENNVIKPVNDSQNREIETYKQALLGLILIMDKKQNTRNYKYWNRRGLNFSGVSNAIIHQLEQIFEDQEKIRGKTSIERKLKDAVKLLNELDQ